MENEKNTRSNITNYFKTYVSDVKNKIATC